MHVKQGHAGWSCFPSHSHTTNQRHMYVCGFPLAIARLLHTPTSLVCGVEAVHESDPTLSAEYLCNHLL